MSQRRYLEEGFVVFLDLNHTKHVTEKSFGLLKITMYTEGGCLEN